MASGHFQNLQFGLPKILIGDPRSVMYTWFGLNHTTYTGVDASGACVNVMRQINIISYTVLTTSRVVNRNMIMILSCSGRGAI